MSKQKIREQVHIIATNEWSKVAAILLQELKNLALAEEATQEAFAAAIDQWPTSGVPQRPGAWLLTVARRKAIDFVKRETKGKEKTEILAQLEKSVSPAEVAIELSLVRDEQLQLIFSCCHPALSVETQLALTLRCVLGLSTEEIARAFLVKRETIAQRLVRGKQKIKKSVIPLRMPRDAELIDRLSVVHTAIYLLYNQHHLSAEEEDASSTSPLPIEAVRLARLVSTLMPNDPETNGLLALLLFLEARKSSHIRGESIVLLADQDRSLWDWDMIKEAQQLLADALKQKTFGPYQMQAAINDLHSVERYELTDWLQIELLYLKLLQQADTPVVRLNHAIAVAESQGVDQGLAHLEKLRNALQDYHYFHATEGELLLRKHDGVQAAAAFSNALRLVSKKPEKAFLEQKISICLNHN